MTVIGWSLRLVGEEHCKALGTIHLCHLSQPLGGNAVIIMRTYWHLLLTSPIIQCCKFNSQVYQQNTLLYYTAISSVLNSCEREKKLQPSSCTCMSGSAHKLACSYFNRTGFINIPIVHMGKECHKNISSRPKTSVLQKAHMCPCSLWSLEHLSLFVHAFVCMRVGHREKPHYSLLHFGAIKTSAPPSPQAPSSPLCTHHTHTHTIPPFKPQIFP